MTPGRRTSSRRPSAGGAGHGPKAGKRARGASARTPARAGAPARPGPPLTVTIDGRAVRVAAEATAAEAMTRAGASCRVPEPVPELAWIHNPDCPLVRLAEVDGRLLPAPLLRRLPVHEGMRIATRSEALTRLLRERQERLHTLGECLLVQGLQETIAAEAESAGHVRLAERASWRFEPRVAEPAVLHDPNRCVRCQACLEACRDVQGVSALTYDPVRGIEFDEARCTRCGQCILQCPLGFPDRFEPFFEWMGCRLCAFARPLGAMREVDDTARVRAYLEDAETFTVVQFAPAVRTSLGQEFGLAPGALVTSQLYAALRRLGFDRVWDTNFSADLTIVEEGNELVARLRQGGVLPQLTSCSPGWIKYVETFHPGLLPNLSSAKSPQQMFGALAKTYGAESLHLDPRRLRVVSIMPCTAKKFEARREEMADAAAYWREKGRLREGERFQDVDVVLTAREAAVLLKQAGLDLAAMPEEPPDPLLGNYTGAATIFGRTGGVMEAALRTAYEAITGRPLRALEFKDLGGPDGVKRGTLRAGRSVLRVAVAHGLEAARRVCESITAGGEFAGYHFIEFMACPGGCVGGGGQPIPNTPKVLRARTDGLNRDDRGRRLRRSHLNPEIRAAYEQFLKKPLSPLSHRLLHTRYVDRSAAVAKPEPAEARG